ncbi:MAG: nitrile hydratase [Rhodomicrobium sp.]
MQEPPLKPHDMGGLTAGEVDRSEKEHVLWEKRVDAMMMLLQRPGIGLVTTDELRKNIEALGPEAYSAMSYYERWVAAIANTLLERGVITSEELGRRIEEVKIREEILP